MFLKDLFVIVVKVSSFSRVTVIIDVSKEFPVENALRALFGVILDAKKRENVKVVDEIEEGKGEEGEEEVCKSEV